MKSIEAIINNKVGLHARPATFFAQLAQEYESDINVIFDDKTVNAKSVMGLLSLGITESVVITITADGSDEEEALKNLTALVESNFGE